MSKKAAVVALLGGAAAVGAAAWAIAPRTSADKQRHQSPEVPDVWYAHRGLHDAGSGLPEVATDESNEYVRVARNMAVKAGYSSARRASAIAPENSLASFAAACEAGYGIELDVQLTADNQIVVVHDEDLMRVAGDPRRIADLTYDELTRIPLFPASKPGSAVAEPLPDAEEDPASVTTPAAAPRGYYQHVPLFSDVLKVVNGRVPLIVEFKSDNNAAWTDRDQMLVEDTADLLADYQGAYVIESFNPGYVNWYKTMHPEVCRGQLAEWPEGKSNIKYRLAGALAFNWMGRPDFIAYDWKGGALPQMRISRAMGATAVSWTLRSSDDYAQCDTQFDRHIFEAFLPPAANSSVSA